MKKILDKIVDKNDKHDMDRLGDIFMDLLDDKEEEDPAEYKAIIYELHKMVNEHLTEDEAKCWVNWMQNKDGTKGAHWTYDQTESVRRQYAPETDPCDFYAVLNMIYSDYYNPKFDTGEYIEMAKDFIVDKDGGKHKTLKYYLFVVKE